MTDYPECEKMIAINEKSQVIGEFLEWIQSGEADNSKFNRPIFLAAFAIVTTYHDLNDVEKDFPEDEWEVGERIMRFSYTTEMLLAKFFKIDMNKVEKERRAMLEEIRRKNAQA